MTMNNSEKYRGHGVTLSRPRGDEYDRLMQVRGWTPSYRAWREYIDDCEEARLTLTGCELDRALDAADEKYAAATNGRHPIFPIDSPAY